MSDEMDCPSKNFLSIYLIVILKLWDSLSWKFILNIFILDLCKYHFKSSGDSIQSPNYPNKYEPSSDCKWTLEGAVGTGIVLQVRFTVSIIWGTNILVIK